MRLGIFSKIYGSNLEDTFRKMKDVGILDTQFNLASAGMETMPATVEISKIKYIKKMADRFGIHICALSGTFNMIDSNIEKRREGIERFRNLCIIAEILEISVVTLCTGSKHPTNKWKWDNRNESEEAWDDLLDTTNKIIPFAEKHNLILGVETEVNNIINTPQKARKYLDTIGSEHLKIIMDGANLFLPEQINNMKQVLEEAFSCLGKDIVIAHAKDLAKSSDLVFVAAGEGVLDYRTYLSLLKQYNYNGPLIMHGLTEEQIPTSLAFLKGELEYANISL